MFNDDVTVLQKDFPKDPCHVFLETIEFHMKQPKLSCNYPSRNEINFHSLAEIDILVILKIVLKVISFYKALVSVLYYMSYRPYLLTYLINLL